MTIITVNFNGSEDTIALLRSLEQQTDRNFDVIVVDNDSSLDSRAVLAAYASTCPLQLDVIFSDRNRGFSGGNNLGIRKALAQHADWLVMLNNDTTVAPDFVAQLRSVLRTPALVALPLQEGGDTAFAGNVRWLHSTLQHLHEPVTKLGGHYVIGAAFAVHRDVVRAVGLMDERFFLYFEDAEYSLRVERVGSPIAYAQEPTVFHKVSASTSRLGSPLLLRYHMRNALLLNSIHGSLWVRIVLPAWAIFSMFKQLVKIVFLPEQRDQSLAIAIGILDFYANRFGKIAPAVNSGN